MLQGKAALITGSTSGIGLGVARALAAEGCALMLNGLGDPDAIEQTRAGLGKEYGVAVHYHGANLKNPAEIDDLIDTAVRELGSIDILMNNAGIQHTAPIETFPPEAWDSILAIHLTASFHTIRRVLPLMRERGWGRIVNTGSAHALVASVHKAAYVAAKHGLLGLSKVVALETAGSGITCNAICPGWVRTELVERQIVARAAAQGLAVEQAARDLLAEKQPSQQFVQVAQVAALVAFLCSDAAAEITGAALPMDGGWTAQ